MLVPFFCGGRAVVSSAQILALSPAAWYRWNTGQLVSQWDDQSGNGRHLVQGTATNQPSLSGGIYTFDGVDNFMSTGAFALSYPFTIFLLAKSITWTLSRRLVNGGQQLAGNIFQSATTPHLRLNSGSSVAENSNLAVDTYGIIKAIFDGASSELQINDTAATSGNAGTNIFSRIYLTQDSTASQFGNVAFAEAMWFPGSMSAGNQTIVKAWLQQQAVLAGITL